MKIKENHVSLGENTKRILLTCIQNYIFSRSTKVIGYIFLSPAEQGPRICGIARLMYLRNFKTSQYFSVLT